MEYYGTIGPACADSDTLQNMVEAGMTGIRMNLSHGSLAEHADWLELIHRAGIPELLIDLQGPELRIGRLTEPVFLKADGPLLLGAQGIPCPAALVEAAGPGQELLLDDGRLLARVDAVSGGTLHCTVLRGGLLESRKSIAAPGLEIHSPTLTAEDLQNLDMAVSCGVTGVMLPFVRGAEDLRTLRRVNGIALCLIDHYFADLTLWPTLQRFDSGSLHDFLREQTGIALRRSQTRISARRAQAKECQRLEIPNMSPLLCVRTLNHRDGESSPAEYSVSLTRADMIEFTMEH